jgi:LmbE family N-acetylglucosaminyl deacetylase
LPRRSSRLSTRATSRTCVPQSHAPLLPASFSGLLTRGLPCPCPSLSLSAQVITFDERGVSLHPNHAAIAKSLPALRAPTSNEDQVRVFSLQTHAPLTKFISFLSVLPPFTMIPGLFPEGRHVKISTNYRGWWKAVRAMRQHASQMTWFRWLYLAGSRYLWTGEYVQVQ